MRHGVTGSLNKRIPAKTVPNAPIPVQTAYAVPIEIPFNDNVSSPKLVNAHTENATDGHSRVKPSDIFKNVVKPTSNAPANSRINQYMPD